MQKLPFPLDLNNVKVLQSLSLANNKIGELKGTINSLADSSIVFNFICLSESLDSCAIENIFASYDKTYKELISKESFGADVKEIINHYNAISYGRNLVKKNGFISINDIVKMHSVVEPNKAGIRTRPGTVIANVITGEIIHRPPQEESMIRELLHNLELYLNDNNDYDPLIQIAILHFQFESIHPFYDGNGRAGRILNLLYLVLKEKLSAPILCLSKYIRENRRKYYELLNKCQKNIIYLEDFVIYMLEGIAESAEYTIRLIKQIVNAIELTKKFMLERLPNIFKPEIVEHLFFHMYTKNELFKEELHLSRATATKYLKLLETKGFITSVRVGKEVIYKNVQLFNLLQD